MSRAKRTCLKCELAAALAEGQSSARWASASGVGERTAQRWAKHPEVLAEVESIRRGAFDRAVGKMSKNLGWAVDGIAVLAQTADSESVKLRALRSILTDTMTMSDFTGLEDRLAKLEEQDRVRHEESASRAG